MPEADLHAAVGAPKLRPASSLETGRAAQIYQRAAIGRILTGSPDHTQP
jgi:hypothetical protein